MSLMFFISGLFIWPSLRRCGILAFVRGRLFAGAQGIRVGLGCILHNRSMPPGVSGASPRVLGRFFREAAIAFRKTNGIQLTSIPNQAKTTSLKPHFSSQRSLRRGASDVRARQPVRGTMAK
jgi:hypothetical protein